jgi:hypothetical protein
MYKTLILKTTCGMVFFESENRQPPKHGKPLNKKSNKNRNHKT